MKKAVCVILCLLLGTTALAAENPFHDVNSSDYFYEPVLWAVAGSRAGYAHRDPDRRGPGQRR